MGEFADMAIDNIINGEYGMWCPSSGYSSYHPKKTIRCNKCGSVDVYWAKVPSGKWCLHANGKPHVCPTSIPRTGRNSNKKELTGYRLVTVNRCENCYYFDGDDRCSKHDYSVVERGVCNDWEDDNL